MDQADAYDYLGSVPDASVDVIFSAQFVEHFPSDRLLELLELAHRRLANGLFIAETVNPESHLAIEDIFRGPDASAADLSAGAPVPVPPARYQSARVFYPTAGGFTQAQYQDAGEYAVIAVR